MTKWEYLVVYVDYGKIQRVETAGVKYVRYTDVERLFNLFGQEGWELAGTSGTASYIFKRPLASS